MICVGDVVAQKIGESLRGEMTVVEIQHPKLVQFSLIDTLAETMRLSSSEVRAASVPSGTLLTVLPGDRLAILVM